jgi:hypothetical protein
VSLPPETAALVELFSCIVSNLLLRLFSAAPPSSRHSARDERFGKPPTGNPFLGAYLQRPPRQRRTNEQYREKPSSYYRAKRNDPGSRGRCFGPLSTGKYRATGQPNQTGVDASFTFPSRTGNGMDPLSFAGQPLRRIRRLAGMRKKSPPTGVDGLVDCLSAFFCRAAGAIPTAV